MKYLKTRPLILTLALLALTGTAPMAGVLTASAAWADVTVISNDETTTTDTNADPAQEEDVRSTSNETCDEVTTDHLRVSRC